MQFWISLSFWIGVFCVVGLVVGLLSLFIPYIVARMRIAYLRMCYHFLTYIAYRGVCKQLRAVRRETRRRCRVISRMTQNIVEDRRCSPEERK